MVAGKAAQHEAAEASRREAGEEEEEPPIGKSHALTSDASCLSASHSSAWRATPSSWVPLLLVNGLYQWLG